MTARDHINRLEQQVSDEAGRQRILDTLLLGLLSDGCVLAEGPSASTATHVVASLARNIDAAFRYVRFAPPLSPDPAPAADLWTPPPHDAVEPLFEPGTVCANIIFVDGFQFAPLWLQMAVFATMGQREVFSAAQAHPLPALFLLHAAHDPTPMRGAHPLSSERRDQFLFSAPEPAVPMPAPTEPAERGLRNGDGRGRPAREPIPQRAIFDARAEVRSIVLPLAIESCLTTLATATIHPGDFSPDLTHWLRPGDGLRALAALQRACRAHAWLCERDTVTLDDVVAVAGDCLRHRLLLTLRARAEGKTPDDLIAVLLEHFVPGVLHEPQFQH